jgi:hypothetical protein
VIKAKEIDGELWIKASDHHQAIKEVFIHKQEPTATLAVREHAPVGKVAYVLEVNLPVGIHKLYTNPPQCTEQNFCSRCGKRTADLTTIHTCTPPRGEA